MDVGLSDCAKGGQTMDKNLLALVVLCLAAGSLYWHWQQATLINQQQMKIEELVNQQQKKIEELEAKTVASPAPSIDMQEKCAAQAKKSVEESGWDNKQQLDSLGYSFADPEYTNHYNSKLEKCFMELTVTSQMKSDPATGLITKSLSDAYEGKGYGGYSWRSVQGKKYWEVPPFQCEMCPDGTEASCQLCKSEAEFDAFAAKYMGDEN
jgi:hypothetical protein